MSGKSYKIRMRKALTMLEMVISLFIMAIIFAAILPQFNNIKNSWASRKAGAEVLQNGRVLIDQLQRSLSGAVRITAVSGPAETNGYIEFEDNSGTTLRCDIAAGSNVEIGPVGNLVELGGPVSSLKFICYSLDDFDTPTTEVEDIRLVKVELTISNLSPMGQDETFKASVYLRTNGDVQQEIIKGSSSGFGITTGNTPALAKITATHYLCGYTGPGDDGWAIVLEADTATQTVSSAGSSFEYDTQMAKDPVLARINATNYLCVYTGPGNDGWAVILRVTPFSWTISAGTPLEFDSSLGLTPDVERIDATHYLCTYTGPGNDGWAVVLTVDAGVGTIAMGAPFEFDTDNGKSPALSRIDNSHYLCAYSGPGSDGWAVVLTVDTGSWTITKETPFEFDSADGVTPALRRIGGSKYLCAYSGSGLGGNGWAVVLTVDTDSWTISKATPFEYDTDRGLTPALVQIDSRRYLCLYRGQFIFLWSTVLVVDPFDWSISQERTTMLTPTQAMQPDVVQIDTENYLCAHEDGTNTGWVLILNIDYTVKP